jgi:hypothetical protein
MTRSRRAYGERLMIHLSWTRAAKSSRRTSKECQEEPRLKTKHGTVVWLVRTSIVIPVAMVAEFDLLQPGRARTATFWKVWPFISIWFKEQRLFARAEPSESSDDEPALPFATSCCVCIEAEVQAVKVCYYCDQWLCAGCYHRDFDRHVRCVGCREHGKGQRQR